MISQQKIINAKKERTLQNKLGFPSTVDFLKIIDENLLLDCPIDCQDVINAETIFSPNLAILKEKQCGKSHTK